MARRPRGPSFDHQRILIAIDQDALDPQDIAGRLALHPQPPAGARMEVRQAGLASPRQRLGVHVRHHQHRAADRIGYDRGEQADGIELRVEGAVALSVILCGGQGNLLWSVNNGRHFHEFLLQDNHIGNPKSRSRRDVALMNGGGMGISARSSIRAAPPERDADRAPGSGGLRGRRRSRSAPAKTMRDRILAAGGGGCLSPGLTFGAGPAIFVTGRPGLRFRAFLFVPEHGSPRRARGRSRRSRPSRLRRA